jgi:exonuclease SbcC
VIVREVRLENVKSYGSPAEVIRFQRGVNAVSGANGAGKSTVLEAIGCVLFQHLPYRHEDFVREGETSGTITVVVESRRDQRTYEVVRRVGRGPAHYVFDPDVGQQIARGEADVGRWLRQHLGLPEGTDLRALFLDSIGPPQGTLTAAFLEAAQQRRLKFNRLLRVEEYEEAFRKLAALDAAFEAEKKQLDLAIARLEETVRTGPGLRQRIAELRQEQEDGERQLARLMARREVVRRQIAELDVAQHVWETARTAHKIAEQQHRHAADWLERARREHAAALDAAEICQAARPGRDAYVATEAKLAELETRRAERDRWVATITRFERELQELHSRASQLDDALARAADSRRQLAELEARIPLQADLEDKLQAVRGRKVQIDEAARRKPAAETRAQRAAERVGAAHRAIADAEQLRPLAAEVAERRAMSEAAAQGLTAAARAAGEVVTLREELKRERARADQLKNQITAIERDERAAAQLRPVAARLESLEDQQRELLARRAGADAQLRHARQTRVQVAGGLCPFLQEECRNLREGVTLETYFDEEIIHWNGELRRFDGEIQVVGVAVKSSREAAKQCQSADQLVGIKSGYVEQLQAVDEHLVQLQDHLASASALATGRSEAELIARQARDALANAERAQQAVERLPILERERTLAAAELEQAESDLAGLCQLLDEGPSVDGDVRRVSEELNRLNSPRQHAVHVRQQLQAVPELEARRQSLDAPINQLSERIRKATELLARHAGLDEELQVQRQLRAQTWPDYEAYVKHAGLADALPNREAALREAAADAAQTADAARNAEAALADAEAHYDAREHLARRNERDELEGEVGETRARREAAARNEALLATQLAAVEDAQRRLAERRVELERLDLDRQMANALRQAVRQAGPEITRQLLGRIGRTASRINAEILNQSGVELEWTTDYEVVTRHGAESRSFAQLSGGEQMSAALAIRLAILRHLSNARLAFLDEPTAHLDQDRRSNLGDQVQRLQGFDQLVVISHDDTFDGLFAHVVHLGRENGRTRVVDQD